MKKQYHLKALLLLVAILNITILVTQLNTPHQPSLQQVLTMMISSAVSLSACWFVHAKMKMHPPVGWPRYTRMAVSLVAGLLTMLLIDYLLDLITPKQFVIGDPAVPPGFLIRLLACFLMSILCYAVFHALFTSDMLQRTHNEIEQLKQVGLRAQVIGLQQQLSPHFLFNSLSTLKSLSQDEVTKEFIFQLSLIYRYLLAGAERQVVTMSDELEFVRAYTFIQEKRFGFAVSVSIDIPEHYMNALLPPLSVQLLIENAIKHNAFSPEQPLDIKIHIDNSDQLIVTNTLRPKNTNTEGTGLGLQNIRERFQLLLNKEITVTVSADHFVVSLPLTKHEDHHH
ncbi:hypothetical protein PBAL39_20414 [Pedobacter sp. BAL39]|uniref:sensor histidine kinase n=1 Tax=Pedobacter sp. BAL39 TaxID=391596 RepID=UPI0001559C10|nr:histidine kinase [Pedobacter sp. BAL39]EDM36284.1 hypothetical protein PBAL39_20414 [Pedobacter sp. BAL39]